MAEGLSSTTIFPSTFGSAVRPIQVLNTRLRRSITVPSVGKKVLKVHQADAESADDDAKNGECGFVSKHHRVLWCN